MRVALLCLDKGGGLAHCAYEFAKAMLGKVDVTCFLTSQNDLLRDFEALPCEVRAFRLQRGPRSLMLAMLTGQENSGVAHAIAGYAPDLVLDVGSGPWGGVVLRPLSGRFPIAQVVHDVIPHPDLRSRMEALPGIIQGPVADVVIGLSEFSSDLLARKYPDIEVIRSKLGIIMPAQSPDHHSVANLRHRHLFLGRIRPYKGLDTLVSAFAIAKAENPKLELSVIGDGRIRQSLLRTISRLGIGLDNRYISDPEIRQVAGSHGVMIVPYSSATQSAIVAVALANAMPVIGTSVGGIPEQVIHGRNGLIVPPCNPEALAQAMIAMSGEAAEARRMSEESLRIGRELYSWSAIAARLLDDLARFLASRGSLGRTE